MKFSRLYSQKLPDKNTSNPAIKHWDGTSGGAMMAARMKHPTYA